MWNPSANDLHSIGGLDPLLGCLKNSHASIRAKAVEVVSTIVQNNPKSQQLVMKCNGLEPLLTNFKPYPSTNARMKALGAISCKYHSRSMVLCQTCAVKCIAGLPKLMLHLASSDGGLADSGLVSLQN
ncbi:hypothetical protein PVAP13_5NG303600 [Panicum virgatum]|uniref:Uncharacterized protein n=1 Tax=Panicum virgatum TaxID=38727 RepID=A0A8T0RUJ3_PANVG|nr:hypothetical protein PVAP13_5NG303600 [Panicum virgatum]